jgi:hypothetical protein
MIHVGKGRISFAGCERSPTRAVALTRQALGMVARGAPAAGAPGPRLAVEVRVGRHMSDAAIARRIADAVTRRLAGDKT